MIFLDVLVKSGWNPTYNGHVSFDVFFLVNGPKFKTVGRNVQAHTQTPKEVLKAAMDMCVLETLECSPTAPQPSVRTNWDRSITPASYRKKNDPVVRTQFALEDVWLGNSQLANVLA